MKKIFREAVDMLGSVPPLALTLLSLSVVCMNLLANKSIDTGLDWLALDCGILFSGVAFLAMDVMTHCYGPRAATVGSLTALVINLLTAGLFFIASRIPGAWGESFVDQGGELINMALNNTIGGTWFVLLGSSIAFAVSAIVNNFLNYGIGERLQSKQGFGTFAIRSYVSTMIAQFTDNIVFALIVSRTFFGWSLLQCFTCALTGAVLELVFEIFFSPIGYQISRRIMQAQGTLPGSAGAADAADAAGAADAAKAV